MNLYHNEEVTEYLPDDPLADVSDIAAIHFKTTNTNRKPDSTSCNKVSFNLHTTIHHRQFECYVCHKSFNRKSNLIAHTSRSHTNTKPFRCKYCSLSFQRTSELLKHVIFHTGDTRNQCRQCKLVLGSEERLEKHKKTHAVIANFQCHLCGTNGFESKRSLFRHTKNCDKKLERSSLTAAVHNDDRITFDCEMCKKRFRRKSNFIAHVKRHYGDNVESEPTKAKTHLCCICGKLFSHRTHLIRHLYIHNGRPYKCEYCGSDFTQRGGLMKHIEKHKRSN